MLETLRGSTKASTGRQENTDDSRLRLAANIERRRTELRMSQEQLAKLTKLGSAQTVSSIEQGKRAVKAIELEALARALHCSWTELLRESDPQPQVAWRQRPTSGAEIDQARFLEYCRNYHKVEQWTGEFGDPFIPSASPAPKGPDFAWYGWARNLATRTGEELDLGSFPATSLLWALENRCGIKVFYFPDLQGAAASSRGPFGAAMVLNATDVRWRRNFSLAHELFHLITWDMIGPTDVDGVLTWPEQTEKWADEFAAALLLPTNRVLESLQAHQLDNEITMRGLIEIAEEFDVSPTTVAWRFVSLRRLSAEHAKELQGNPDFKRRDSDAQGRTVPEQVYGLPLRFARLLKTAYLRGTISAKRVADMLGKRLADTRRDLLAQWEEDEASVRQVVRLT